MCNTGKKNKESVKKFSPEISPGLGGLQNKHLTVIIFNRTKSVSLAAHGAFDEFFEYAPNVVSGDMPSYFFIA